MRSENWIEEVHQLVGKASVCWDKDGVFKEQDALAVVQRLIDIVREQRVREPDTPIPRRRRVRIHKG